MFPGISVPQEGLASFLAGEPWAVKVPGNPAAIAVSIFGIFTYIYLPIKKYIFCGILDRQNSSVKLVIAPYLTDLGAGWRNHYEQY